MTKKKKQAKKLNIFVIIISIALIVLSIYLNNQGAIRPLLWIIAIILISINIVNGYNLKFYKVFPTFIILFIVSLILDGIIVISINRIPVFAYNIITTRKTIVYNSVGVRVWQCNKENYNNVLVDVFYNNGYMCDAEDIDEIDSNSFLNSVVENYLEYKNTYVKINGKISKKTGQNYIEMNPYEKTEVTLNGYVPFANNITLRIIFNEPSPELDNYDVYDEITIVGIIKNMENESGNYVIYMYDSKVVSSVNLTTYSISATKEDVCSVEKNTIYTNSTNNIYSYCLKDIIVTYSNDNKYELSYALSSNKLNINQLNKKYFEKEKSTVDDSTIYRFESYSLLMCDKNKSKDIIFGPKDMTFENVTCDIKVE